MVELYNIIQSPFRIIAWTLLGIMIGFLTGLFGVGGGFMLTPLLNVLFDIPYPVAAGSSLCYLIGSSSSGMVRHMRMKNVELKTMLILAGGCANGTFLGVMLQHLFQDRFDKGHPGALTLIMHGLFIVLLLVSACLIMLNPREGRGGRTLLQRLPFPPRIELPGAGLRGVSLPGLCLIGLVVGILQGLMGIGGGVILMPVLMLILGLGAHQAVGTCLGVVFFGSVIGVVKYGLANQVSLWIALTLLTGGSLGIQIGAWVCMRLHGRQLSRYFCLLILGVIFLLIGDFVRKLGYGHRVP